MHLADLGLGPRFGVFLPALLQPNLVFVLLWRGIDHVDWVKPNGLEYVPKAKAIESMRSGHPEAEYFCLVVVFKFRQPIEGFLANDICGVGFVSLVSAR